MKRINQLSVVFLLVFSLIVCINPLSAKRFQSSLSFNVGMPLGEFDENIDKTALGFDLNFGMRMGKSPFILGIDLGYLNYGKDSRYESLYLIPDMVVNVVNSYDILQGHMFLRFQPIDHGPVRPYVDFLAGVNYLRAETSIEDDDWDEDDISSVNYEDTAFSYGLGGGMMVRFGGRDARKKSAVEFLLDLRVRYILGGRAEYLKEGSIVVEDQEVTYYVYESKTDLLSFQIGVAMTF